MISLGEVGTGEILLCFSEQLGEGSIEIKQPQPSLDTASSLDNPGDVLGTLICNRI